MHRKTWSLLCARLLFEGSRIALIVKPSNAESPTSLYRKDICFSNPRNKTIIYKSTGRSRCFVSDYQMEFARFSKSQNQSVQKTPFMYVCLCIWSQIDKLCKKTLQKYE